MWSCVGVVFLLACAGAVTRTQLYSFGKPIDQRLPSGREIQAPEIPLKVPIVFFGETYESVFVNNYGVLSFRADISQFLNSEFPLPYPSIAAFYTNVDTSTNGDVFYRETDDGYVIAKAKESVQSSFHEYSDFQPTSVFIATWAEVTYSGSNQSQLNSFQIAVINNGTESFVELLYPERDIQWIQSETPATSLPDAKAQAGFTAEDGRLFLLRGSGSHQIRNIVSWSNTNEPGKYIYRVGMIPHDGTVAIPDQYNQSEADLEEESKTCAQSGPSVCHIQARCVDYEAGICCQCNNGFYGNGKSCIKNDVPLRVHGRLNGILNDISLNDVDIQAYVVIADGRSYTALSQVPQSLGTSLQLLSVIGGVVGWMFAVPSGTAKNGYQLTGSLFNYSADVTFPATGDRVTINQEYQGHDVFDQISLETDVRGSVPTLPYGTKLEVSEYEEQYTMESPGVLRSESTRLFTNKVTGEKYEHRVSQTFTFNTCHYAPPSEEESIPSTLKVAKNYLGYETRDNIVRYGMSNKIIPFGSEDPCVKGKSTCGPHSSCVVSGDSFTCVCKSGFTNTYTENGVACVDVDECAAGTHYCDANADCYNHDGGFQCRCRSGFDGDGRNCNRADGLCDGRVCHPNAQCLNNGAAECICNPGFTGDGQRCYEILSNTCDIAHNCNLNAACLYSAATNGYICQCNPGYAGDGYYCREDAPYITTTPEPHEEDYNDTIVLPNCDSYGCNCPSGYSSYRDERDNELCRLDNYPYPSHGSHGYPEPHQDYNDTGIRCFSYNDCPPNALCTTDGSSEGRCECAEGYEGDAYECIEKTGPLCSCGPKAHCIDTSARELICVCDSGYHGDGYVCRPNFSCNNNSDCEYHAECRPDASTNEYVCQCIEGYVKDQNDACIPDGQLCSDAVCAEFASCLYDDVLKVSYCHCDDGYEGDGISSCAIQGHTCDVINTCSPDANCLLIDSNYQCVCQSGFIGDGYSCTPEANCRSNPYMCDTHASCLKRSDTFLCECNTGYNGNGSYCELNPRQAGNFLVASDGVFVYRVPFQSTARDYASPINSAIDQIAVGIDVDCQTGRIYWGDVVSSTIKRAAYDGSGYEPFLLSGLKAPEGVSIDWSARNIFWTDAKKLTIEVANLDTRIRKTLFAIDGIVNPRGIAVHPQRGKIFWSDWNRAGPKIEWANMDGSQRGVFVDQPDVKLPNSLAIDWSRDRLCYADAGLSSIRCVGIDTQEREVVAPNCAYPFGLAISGDRFYWSDWKNLKIEYIDIRTQVRGQVPISTSNRRLYGVALAPESCPTSSNVCSYRNGNCGPSELCLPDGRGGRTCVAGDTTYDMYDLNKI